MDKGDVSWYCFLEQKRRIPSHHHLTRKVQTFRYGYRNDRLVRIGENRRKRSGLKLGDSQLDANPQTGRAGTAWGTDAACPGSSDPRLSSHAPQREGQVHTKCEFFELPKH